MGNIHFFVASKAMRASAVLILGIVATNVQPITSSEPTTKGLSAHGIPLHKISMDKQALNAVASETTGDDDDWDTLCPTEYDACVADPDCLACYSGSDGADCDEGFSCSTLIDQMCCMYGDSCSSNALLVSLIDCAVDGYGCQVTEDICDTEDDNGARTVESDDECPVELQACWDDADCLMCFEDSADDCVPASLGCDDMTDYACCAFGDTDGCTDNDLLLEYLNCFLEETSVDDDCAITELCNGGGSKYSGYSSVILVAAAAALLVAVVDMVF